MNFEFWIHVILTFYIYVIKYVRIRDYLSKLKGVCKQDSLGTNALGHCPVGFCVSWCPFPCFPLGRCAVFLASCMSYFILPMLSVGDFPVP